MTNYIVSPDGNDQNEGTEDRPFRTIGRAAEAADKPGDHVYVKGDPASNYYEQLRINKNGRQGDPIRFLPYEGHNPLIDGRAGIGGINNGLPGGSFPDGAKLLNPKTGARAKLRNLVAITADYIVWSIDIGGHGDSTGSLGRGLAIHDRAKYVTVENCRIGPNRQSNILITEGASYITIRSNVVTGSGSYYPERRGSSRETDWSAAVVVQNAGPEIIISRNKIFRNWGEAGISDANKGRSHAVIWEYNEIHSNFKGLYIHALPVPQGYDGIPEYNAIVRYNKIYRTDAETRNPVFTSDGSRGIAINSGEHERFGPLEMTDYYIHDNLILGRFGTGIGVPGSPNKPMQRRGVIAFNTIIGPDTGLSFVVHNAEDMIAVNNLIARCNTPISGNNIKQNWRIDYNLYDRQPTAEARGNYDVIANPMLSDIDAPIIAGQVDAADYMPRANSPAVGAGDSSITRAFEHDLVGIIRPTKPTIGALEPTGDIVDPPEPPDPPPGPDPELPPLTLNAIENPDQLNSYIVTWDPDPLATEYRIQHQYEAGGWGLDPEGIGDFSAYLFQDMAPGVWCHRVRYTRDPEGPNRVYSDWSNIECTIVGVDTPEPPDPPPGPEVVTAELTVGGRTWRIEATEDQVTIKD